MREEEVLVPLISENDILGIIGLGQKISGDTYTPDDLVFLSLIGNICSIAIKKNKYIKSLKHSEQNLALRVRDLTTIENVTKLLNSSFDMETLGKRLIENLTEILQADSGILMSKDKTDFVIQEIVGDTTDIVTITRGIPIFTEHMKDLFKAESGFIYPAHFDKSDETINFSLVFVPIKYNAKIFGGILLIRKPGKKEFIDDDFNLPPLVSKLIDEPPQTILSGQFLNISTLVGDMRGFVSLCEILTPEEIVDFLNGFYSDFTSIVLKNNGLVDKFIGDGVMAVFGINLEGTTTSNNVAMEGNAIKAGVQLQKVFSNYVKKWSRDNFKEMNIELGIGICTGRSFVGNVGSHLKMEYTVLGREVNLAARLSSICKGGQILTDEKTVRIMKKDDILSNDGIAIKELPPVLIKGMGREIRLFEVEYR